MLYRRVSGREDEKGAGGGGTAVPFPKQRT